MEQYKISQRLFIFNSFLQLSSTEDMMLMNTLMVYELRTSSVTVKIYIYILWENYLCPVHSMCIYVQRTNANQK